ncbi:MAG: sugar phosphate isomerase/epimerase [Gammaproteobacteria bacterium]|nr:sugar phosphate isomerase/epimerase [Gammaproteobacteria bacterium]
MTATSSAAGSGIKRGVSLYSFQEEYFLRKMTLEDCIATCARFGATGIESIAEQMMPGFPNLPDAFYEQWHGWMARYGTTPTCHDAMLDTKRYKHRLLTDDEVQQDIERDLRHARRLGCKVVRMLVFHKPEWIERAIPIAEKYDVKMGIEVHAPWHFDHPWIQRHLEMIERTGTRHAGFVPDMGIYTQRLPRVVRDRAERNGGTPKILDHVCEAYAAGILSEYVIFEARRMGGNAVDLGFAEQCRHAVNTPPKRLIEYMPYIFHIHAKFYDMVDEQHEYSIPYDRIVAALKAGNYQGYLSSEYEGNRHIQDAFPVDSVEQVRRQHRMFERLLAA